MIAYILLLLMQVTESDKMIPTVLHFDHIANEQKIEQDKVVAFTEAKKYKIKKWKYYISHLELVQADDKLIAIPGVFLIDAFGKDSIVLQLPSSNYIGVKFTLGIDSSIHMSGAQDGDLDPLNGMYWAWNTGYIHFKLEGETQIVNREAERFQYHIGGFAGQNDTKKKIILPFFKKVLIDKTNHFLPEVSVNLVHFFDSRVTDAEGLLVMKEGFGALAISSLFPKLFTIKK